MNELRWIEINEIKWMNEGMDEMNKWMKTRSEMKWMNTRNEWMTRMNEIMNDWNEWMSECMNDMERDEMEWINWN